MKPLQAWRGSALARWGWLVAALVAGVGIGGCATPAAPQAMAAVAAAPLARQHPQSVSVAVIGGSATGALDSSNIADADLKAAIERSITDTRLFSSVLQGPGAYCTLTVSVVQMRKPMWGGTFTVDLELGWTLVRNSDQQVLLRKALGSHGTATMGDAFAGVTRLRLALERAAQDNIRQGLNELAALTL